MDFPAKSHVWKWILHPNLVEAIWRAIANYGIYRFSLKSGVSSIVTVPFKYSHFPPNHDDGRKAVIPFPNAAFWAGFEKCGREQTCKGKCGFLQQGNGNGFSCCFFRVTNVFLGWNWPKARRNKQKNWKNSHHCRYRNRAMYWKKQKVLQNPGCWCERFHLSTSRLISHLVAMKHYACSVECK